MNKIPQFLKKGDTIGITCPAGAVNLDEMQDMFNQLEAWGYKLRIGKTVGSRFYKFSANDEERRNELQTFLDDDSIKAILFGRGGYGLVRIIDQLDFTQFEKKMKWLVGYSDITCLHSHIQTQFNIVTIHAHMGSGYRKENQDLFSTIQINEVLCGMPVDYSIEAHEMNRLGSCNGILTGGNLALISDLIGTKSDIYTTNKILVIEDIGEYKYNIDRMMWQLARSGKLENLAGLIVGSFTDTLDNEVPFGLSVNEIIFEKVKAYQYPVCFNFPIGHQPLNYPLKLGIQYELSVTQDGVKLYENNFL